MIDLTPRPSSTVAVEGSFCLRSLSVRIGTLHTRVAAPARNDTAVADRLQQLDHLVRKRLDIVRGGLREACRQVRAGQNDEATVLVSKLEEDLDMLQRRIQREFNSAAPASRPAP
jgi:hypothetical protein